MGAGSNFDPLQTEHEPKFSARGRLENPNMRSEYQNPGEWSSACHNSIFEAKHPIHMK